MRFYCIPVEIFLFSVKFLELANAAEEFLPWNEHHHLLHNCDHHYILLSGLGMMD